MRKMSHIMASYAKGIRIFRNKCFIWMLLLILLELLPASLQVSERQKRQIVFPGENVDTSAPPCIAPDGRAGVCIPLTSCPVLMRIGNFNRLRRFFCGFSGDEPRVCCPNSGRPSSTRTTPPPVRTTRRTTSTPIRTTRRTTSTPIRTTRRTTRRITTRPTTQRPSTIRTNDFRFENRSDGGTMPAFLPKSCGTSLLPKTRVVGGREADKGSWPWMVVIYQERRGTKSPDCGGALVTNQHVVTAAHCVVGRRATPLEPRYLSVRLGEHDLYNNDDDMNPIDVSVSTVTRHDRFNPRTYENDIAVLRLTQPVQFGNHIAPICLPYDAFSGQDLTGKRAFVAGWGTTSFNGPSSAVLREVSFEIQNQELCREAYKNDIPIKDVYVCAGKLDGTKDSCQGDSGGPLMSVSKKKFYLVGVVSFGKLCATPGYPGVYTRVTEFLDWLRPLLLR